MKPFLFGSVVGIGVCGLVICPLLCVDKRETRGARPNFEVIRVSQLECDVIKHNGLDTISYFGNCK